jgi:hypothetical protein
MKLSIIITVIISAVILQIIGLSLFIFGFFPVKPALSGVRSLSLPLSLPSLFPFPISYSINLY